MYYIFTPHEIASNVERHENIFNWNFKQILCNSNKLFDDLIVELNENDIIFYNKYHNKKYKGHLNLYTSVFDRNRLKLIYDLESSIDFIGGTFILEPNQAIFIYNGSGLPYFSAYKGSILKV